MSMRIVLAPAIKKWQTNSLDALLVFQSQFKSMLSSVSFFSYYPNSHLCQQYPRIPIFAWNYELCYFPSHITQWETYI